MSNFLDRQDYVILNSVTNVSKAIDALHGYERIHCLPDNDGNTISDRNERLRSTRICKELTLKYGLHMSNGKENVKRDRLKEPARTIFIFSELQIFMVQLRL